MTRKHQAAPHIEPMIFYLVKMALSNLSSSGSHEALSSVGVFVDSRLMPLSRPQTPSVHGYQSDTIIFFRCRSSLKETRVAVRHLAESVPCERKCLLFGLSSSNCIAYFEACWGRRFVLLFMTVLNDKQVSPSTRPVEVEIFNISAAAWTYGSASQKAPQRRRCKGIH